MTTLVLVLVVLLELALVAVLVAMLAHKPAGDEDSTDLMAEWRVYRCPSSASGLEMRKHRPRGPGPRLAGAR